MRSQSDLELNATQGAGRQWCNAFQILQLSPYRAYLSRQTMSQGHV